MHSGSPVSGARVEIIRASDSSTKFDLTTDSNGYTPRVELIDYINSGGTKEYYSLYDIQASKTTWFGEHYFNSTLNQNYEDSFSI
jgi:hypothetical protein